ncbi:hypothetical protein [Okeania sp.]|uniref:hypothetical protein n=1 Tax=Okeania sp. TaxID=3100323 RepID=UPI002B4ACA37|nr:hypothetical protein [Okeania sp.]MEB3342339.1 hypothetical protein [Okeania sp.]
MNQGGFWSKSQDIQWHLNDSAEQEGTNELISFFGNRLKGLSKLTPMIYTDRQPTDAGLNSGASQAKDFSVLKNVDYVGQIAGDAGNNQYKRNSQTLQARIVQAYENKEPVCLRVHGKRDNDRSQFFNIVQFTTVEQQYQDKYNDLKRENNSQDRLVELTKLACPNQTN